MRLLYTVASGLNIGLAGLAASRHDHVGFVVAIVCALYFFVRAME